METFIKTVSGFGPSLSAVFFGLVASAVVIAFRCIRSSVSTRSRWTPFLVSTPLLFGVLGSVLSIHYVGIGLVPTGDPDAEIFAWLISRIHVFLGTGFTLWFVCCAAYFFRTPAPQ